MKQEKALLVILGAGGFPHRLTATGNKFFLLAKALAESGFDVSLINQNRFSDEVERLIVVDDIKCYSIINKKRKNNPIPYLLDIFNLLINVLKILNTPKTTKKYLVISYCNVLILAYYWFVTKVLKYRLVFSLMEDHLTQRKKIHNRINAFLFWNFGIHLADGALPISAYLKEQVLRKNKRLPVFTVPVLADYSKISNKPNKRKKYFLYCGGTGYYDVIDLIIESFKYLNDSSTMLYLVLHGKEDAIKKYKELYSNSNIRIFYNVPQSDLMDMYTGSEALLIPMRPTKQDIARFPQKIAEYLASGRPILTNNIGEIKYYFKDKINAVFASDYSKCSYTEAMRFVLKNPQLSDSIGLNGQKLGERYFHYQNISEGLSQFILSI